MKNMKKIKHGIYLVRTQAGFKKAIKDYFTPLLGEDDLKCCMESGVVGYPVSYPSVVSLTLESDYPAGDFIMCRSIHVNDLKVAIYGE